MKIILRILTLVSLPFFVCCSSFPVLSELLNSRLSLILKGTYETNDPYPWNDIIYNNEYVEQEPLASNLNIAVNSNDLKLYLDIARIVVSEKNPTNFIDIDENDQRNFAIERQLLCASNISIDDKELKECIGTNGIEKLDAFFEEGFSYPAKDLEVKEYKSMAILLRKFVSRPSFTYNASLEETQEDTLFDNRDIYGSNIKQFYDYRKEDDSNSTPSRFFYLYKNDLKLIIPDTNAPFTLEIRIFLKNLLMKHIVKDGNNRTTFIGPSDWLEYHEYDNTSSNPPINQRLGGTILIGVRIYSNMQVNDLLIRNFNAERCIGGLSYFALIPAGETFNISKLPLVATRTSALSIKNISFGEYDLYITQDKKEQASNGLEDGEDGFPESHRICKMNINITPEEVQEVDVSDCECP